MDELDGQGGFQDLLDAHGRIVTAFEKIAAGAEALAARAESAPDPAELARLRAEIEEERTVNAQLAERVRVLRERQDPRLSELEESLAQARARITELEAERAASRAEVDAVLTELIPLVEEAR